VSPVPPPLEELVGEWMSKEELRHLHSLRNQWGQAHVNADLTSLSWLAMPPFSGGYHTGVLRVNGHVPTADRSRWAPWGVQREAVVGCLRVLTDVRMAYEATRIMWSVTATNEGTTQQEVRLDQELNAPIAHSEVDWGWVYGTPWNSGHYHDYYATERLRTETTADAPRQVQLIPHDARVIRLGRPRVPGIQRDEDAEAMLLESALPDHTTSDSGRIIPDAAICEVGTIEVSSPDSSPVRIGGVHRLDRPDSELRLDAVAIVDGSTLTLDVLVSGDQQTGVIMTHGNHPDSLQLGLRDGAPWVAIGGEQAFATEPLTGGSHRLSVAIAHDAVLLVVDGVEVARTRSWWDGQRWVATVDDGILTIVDRRSPAHSAYATSVAPDRLVAEGSRGLATWTATLQPGETMNIRFSVDFGTEKTSVESSARQRPQRFENDFAAVADRWRQLWANAFTPGNPDHSGYLPTFAAVDPGLARTYYLGILLALYVRNTGISSIGPVFLTGGPRLGATTTFYWDISEWARTASLLEPVGMRAWILAALAQPYESSHSFDTRNLLPVGNHYAANDHALFRTIQAYVGVTGDTALLEAVARGKTVLDHLRGFAYRPREKHARFGVEVLVDLGSDAWELLECVPNYTNAVVSFNAGYVGMLRSLAGILAARGESVESDVARLEANALARAVLAQYAGAGRWKIAHPDRTDIIGHCLDFELVAADMAGDLTDVMKQEMVDFVTEHLIDGEWMRALSPDDPIAPLSDRPDHGAAGAFAGWPGSTSYGLTRLGRPDLAAAFLGRVHNSRSGALWGQAVESMGAGRFAVAERGVSNRDSNAAVAVTEAVIAGLFGIRADFENLSAPAGETSNRFGSLHGVRAVGFDLTGQRTAEASR
jgi:hypothetical protein